MAKSNNLRPQIYDPPRCWVGDVHKICYPTREEAEAAARIAEHAYPIAQLKVYRCPYGPHYHLSSA